MATNDEQGITTGDWFTCDGVIPPPDNKMIAESTRQLRTKGKFKVKPPYKTPHISTQISGDLDGKPVYAQLETGLCGSAFIQITRSSDDDDKWRINADSGFMFDIGETDNFSNDVRLVAKWKDVGYAHDFRAVDEPYQVSKFTFEKNLSFCMGLQIWFRDEWVSQTYSCDEAFAIRKVDNQDNPFRSDSWHLQGAVSGKAKTQITTRNVQPDPGTPLRCVVFLRQKIYVHSNDFRIGLRETFEGTLASFSAEII